MDQYSQDHKFSQAVSECFRDIGEHQFVNPISSYPWGGRNRIVGRIRVFEKYLKPEDVLHARWLQNRALQENPSDWRSREVGIEHLNKLMDERSGGTHFSEMDEVAKAQPSLAEYMENEYGPSGELVKQWKEERVKDRREQMRLVVGSSSAAERVSVKQPNSLTYLESGERALLYQTLRTQAQAMPEYEALVVQEKAAIEVAQAHELRIVEEATRLLDEKLKKPGSEEVFFEGLDATARAELRLTLAKQLFTATAEKNLGGSKWVDVSAARATIERFVVEHFVKHMPPDNPYSEGARQRRDQQESEEFKRWFAGSKVVCEDGLPVIAFHGTASQFDQFIAGDDDMLKRGVGPRSGARQNSNYSGPMGAWFAAPAANKHGYDEGNAECISDGFCSSFEEDTGFRAGACVMPVYLNIKNPMEFEGFEDFQDERDEYPDLFAMKQAMISEGYDGFVIRDCYTDGDAMRDDWVAFSPSQIKSALGNSGSFDPASASLVDQPQRYLVLNIDPSTEAFQDVGRSVEIARIVREGFARGAGPVHDLNGNQVGKLAYADFVDTAWPDASVVLVLNAETAGQDADAVANDIESYGVLQGAFVVEGRWVGAAIVSDYPVLDLDCPVSETETFDL